MARVGTNLFLRKTLRASSSTTFNAPGNYLPPYGSTVIQIGGRGASGNPTVPGNTVPGNVSGSNPGSPGNVSGTNPSTVSGHNYGVYQYTVYYYTSRPASPPGLGPSSFSSTGTSPGPYPGSGSVPGPSPSSHFGGPDPDPPYGYGQYYHQSATYTPAYFTGNPNFSPGNPNYNPYVPGNPNYNPTNTNPTTPGNAGTPANIEGVPFPGGSADSVAPTVPYTSTTVVYTGSNISITVPSGGYVNIQNI